MTRIAVYGPAGVTAADEMDSRPLWAFFGRHGTNARDRAPRERRGFCLRPRAGHIAHLKETQ